MIRMSCACAIALVLGGLSLFGCSSGGMGSRPLAGDSGVTSLDDLTSALCVGGESGAIRWVDTCGGSIVVVQGMGIDCRTYWLFDATTKSLQATAQSGNAFSPVCTGSIPGFRLPSACFDGTPPSGVTPLCPSGPPDGGSDTT
jgi:hypothetical protein